jgi:hypothetical protein
MARLLGAGFLLAFVLVIAQGALAHFSLSGVAHRDLSTLVLLAAIGGVAYGGAVMAMFGKKWIAALQRGGSRA